MALSQSLHFDFGLVSFMAQPYILLRLAPSSALGAFGRRVPGRPGRRFGGPGPWVGKRGALIFVDCALGSIDVGGLGESRGIEALSGK